MVHPEASEVGVTLIRHSLSRVLWGLFFVGDTVRALVWSRSPNRVSPHGDSAIVRSGPPNRALARGFGGEIGVGHPTALVCGNSVERHDLWTHWISHKHDSALYDKGR